MTCLPVGLGGEDILRTYSRTSGPPNCFTRIPRNAAITGNTSALTKCKISQIQRLKKSIIIKIRIKLQAQTLAVMSLCDILLQKHPGMA